MDRAALQRHFAEPGPGGGEVYDDEEWVPHGASTESEVAQRKMAWLVASYPHLAGDDE